MLLGAATNFAQGNQPRMMRAAAQLPLRHFRDGIYWHQMETEDGYRFDNPRVDYPSAIAAQGGDLVLTVNFGNPLYDGGNTPHSPEALAAFGRHVAALVESYPAIVAVEIGNEVNGQNYVRGPVRERGLSQRARYHAAMVRAAAQAARAVRPDIRILGGAAHSIPAQFLWDVLDESGPGVIDGLVIHPYTTPIDQLAAQIGVLRRHPQARDLAIEVTEFGSEDPASAPADLVRGYAALASLGVHSLFWYPFNSRGADSLVPLVAADGTPTAAGEAFRFVQAELATRTARDVSPDAFTHMHLFGADRLVIWGEPRSLAVGTGLSAFDARGRALDVSQLRLSPDEPIVLTSARPIDLARDVSLGCSDLVADSFLQFRYEEPGAADRPGFASWLSGPNGRREWTMKPGQERGGVPWVPYLAPQQAPLPWLSADQATFGNGGPEARNVVHAFRSERAARLQLDARLEQAGDSGARFDFAASGGGLAFARENVEEVILSQQVSLGAGESLTLELSPGAGQPIGRIAYRYRLRDLDRCATTG